MEEDSWQIYYTSGVTCVSTVRWCRFIAFLCMFKHVWRWLVFGRVLIWCFQGDLNIYCCWEFCLYSLLFPFLIMSLSIFYSADAPWLLFVHPFLYSWIFQVYLSSFLYPCKHQSHTSFLSPCILSGYWVLSLFIAPGLINCTWDLSLTHAFITLFSRACSLYLNSLLVSVCSV